jgi:hypothetical protein
MHLPIFSSLSHMDKKFRKFRLTKLERSNTFLMKFDRGVRLRREHKELLK